MISNVGGPDYHYSINELYFLEMNKEFLLLNLFCSSMEYHKKED